MDCLNECQNEINLERKQEIKIIFKMKLRTK